MIFKDMPLGRWLVELSLLGTAIAIVGSGCASSGTPQMPPDRVCGEVLLRTLGEAIVQYRTEHGDLPPVVSRPGGLQHSWRALLAPTWVVRCDHPDRIDYCFDEPWDSPHNRDALRVSTLFCRYTCPLENPTEGYNLASYVMMVRPAVKDPSTGRLAQPALPDDAVLIVESANCGIEYGEPRDLDWDTLWQGDSPFGPGKLNSLHDGVVKAVRVDGKVIDIPKNLPKEKLRKLLSGSDGT